MSCIGTGSVVSSGRAGGGDASTQTVFFSHSRQSLHRTIKREFKSSRQQIKTSLHIPLVAQDTTLVLNTKRRHHPLLLLTIRRHISTFLYFLCTYVPDLPMAPTLVARMVLLLSKAEESSGEFLLTTMRGVWTGGVQAWG